LASGAQAAAYTAYDKNITSVSVVDSVSRVLDSEATTSTNVGSIKFNVNNTSKDFQIGFFAPTGVTIDSATFDTTNTATDQKVNFGTALNPVYSKAMSVAAGYVNGKDAAYIDFDKNSTTVNTDDTVAVKDIMVTVSPDYAYTDINLTMFVYDKAGAVDINTSGLGNLTVATLSTKTAPSLTASAANLVAGHVAAVDDSNVTLLFNLTDVKNGQVIDITLPTGVTLRQDVNMSIGTIADNDDNVSAAVQFASVLTDGEAYPVSVTESNSSKSNIRLTLGVSGNNPSTTAITTVPKAQVKATIAISQLEIASSVANGNVVATLTDSNATYTGEGSTVVLGKKVTDGTAIVADDINSTYLITIGSSKLKPVADINLTEYFAGSWGSEDNITVTMKVNGSTTGITSYFGSDVNVSAVVGGAQNHTLGSGGFSISGATATKDTVQLNDINVTISSGTADQYITATIAPKTGQRTHNIQSTTVNVAKLVAPAATVHALTTDANLTASGSDFIAKMDVNETYYSSLLKTLTKDYGVFFETATEGVTINATGSSVTSTTNSLLTSSGAAENYTAGQVITFPIANETSTKGNGTFDINLSIASTVATGTEIKLKAYTKDKLKDFGEFVVGKVSSSGGLTALADVVKVTDLSETNQSIGKIRVQELIKAGFAATGSITLVAPEGIKFTNSSAQYITSGISSINSKYYGSRDQMLVIDLTMSTATLQQDENISIGANVSALAESPGQYTITVSDGNLSTGTAKNKIGFSSVGNLTFLATTDGTIPAPTVASATATVAVDATVQISATANTDGTLSYTSNATDKATVDAAGLVTGVAEGEAIITVLETVGSVSSEANVTVTVTAAEVVEPTPDNAMTPALVADWNLLGNHSSAAVAASAFTDAGATAVWTYDATNGWLGTADSTLTEIASGAGFWVKVPGAADAIDLGSEATTTDPADSTTAGDWSLNAAIGATTVGDIKTAIGATKVWVYTDQWYDADETAVSAGQGYWVK
jgi:hypothetical protein